MKRKVLACLLLVLVVLSLATIVACDETPTYNVAIESSEHGSVTADVETVEEGGKVTLTVTPDAGYELQQLIVNGESVQVSGGTYAIENVVADVTVSATFSKLIVTYTVTFDYGIGSGEESTRRVVEGAIIGDLPAASVANGILKGWYVGTTSIDKNYIVNSDVTVKASFITAEISLSGQEALYGLSEGNVIPTVSVAAKLDGEVNSDIVFDISVSDSSIATLEGNELHAIADGSVAIVVKYNDQEIARSANIACRSYVGFTAVSDKAGFLAIADDKAGKYYLTQNIDLENTALWDTALQPLFGTFTGVIDGRGYSVSNAYHPSGWDQGIFAEMNGTIRNIAFINFYSQSTQPAANNAVFGKITGTLENVYLDYNVLSTGPIDEASGIAPLGAYIESGANLRNVVVNIRTNKDKFMNNVAGIAVAAQNWLGSVNNVVVMTNGKALTAKVSDGLYLKEAASGLGTGITANSGAFLYTYTLLHSELDISWLEEGLWSVRDGAVYFGDIVALVATPEYDVAYSGGNITKNYETSLPSPEVVSVDILHNAEKMDEIPEELVTFNSTDSSVAVIGIDEDGSIFIDYKGKGTATLSVSINDRSVSFTVTVSQIMHITSVEDFRTKVPQALNGVIVLDNDIDFNNETVQGKNDDDATIWKGLGNFSGSFDGQGHSISNLVLGDGWEGGIFTSLNNGGVIKNTAFINIQSVTNAHGLFGSIDNATFENCYVDFVFKGNGLSLDANWCATGPICVAQNPAGIIKNTIINIRFAEEFDFDNIDRIGAISGKALAWSTMSYNVKVIVNANVSLKRAYADGAANDGVQAQWTTCATYSDYAALYGSGVTAYTDYWTIGADGITFGTNEVLTVSSSEGE